MSGGKGWPGKGVELRNRSTEEGSGERQAANAQRGHRQRGHRQRGQCQRQRQRPTALASPTQSTQNPLQAAHRFPQPRLFPRSLRCCHRPPGHTSAPPHWLEVFTLSHTLSHTLFLSRVDRRRRFLSRFLSRFLLPGHVICDT